MKYLPILFLFAFTILLNGCSKMQEKKTGDDTKAPQTQTPPPGKTENAPMTDSKSGQTDEKATELSKSADDAIVKYTTDKSDANKTDVINKCLAAGNYLTFEASLPAREKYRPALKYYRKVLEADPKNEEAQKNKKQIEDIYTQMGMPIPQ